MVIFVARGEYSMDITPGAHETIVSHWPGVQGSEQSAGESGESPSPALGDPVGTWGMSAIGMSDMSMCSP